MPITETIQDVNQMISRTALMHRDEPEATVLKRAIEENFPGLAVKEVLVQAEINFIRAQRERQQARDADKLIAVFPDVQGRLFDDELPVAFVPLELGGRSYRKVTLAEFLDWARARVAARQTEVEAHRRTLALAQDRLHAAEDNLVKHEVANAWCVKHGLNPAEVTYAEIREAATA